MYKIDISKITKSVKALARKHTPEILIGLGTAGMITTAVMTGKATIKAVRIIDEKKVNENKTIIEKKEVVKAVWRCYIPPVITGSISITCIIFASSVNLRRNAALATAFELSEKALNTYKTKVIETVGEKKEKTVEDSVAKQVLNDNPVKNSEVLITEKGDTLCYDYYSGRYFKSDIEAVRRAVNTLNARMIDDGYASLNDFYYEVGLDNIAIGVDLGWNVNKGLIKLDCNAQLASDSQPCMVVNFSVAPTYDYYNFHY